MNKYIKTISLALFSVFCLTPLDAQEINDAMKKDINIPYGKVSQDRLVGSVDVITSEELDHTTNSSVKAAMSGLSVGLLNGSTVRGYTCGNKDNDDPLWIIDGLVDRNISQVNIEEVQSIEILKDVTAKMLYGSKAANGVIVVTTKRGYLGHRKISFELEYGYEKLNPYRDYLGTADYMKYYNQALMNDGKSSIYPTDTEIDSIVDNGLIGTSKYPDVDYYDMFIKDHSAFTKANVQLIGGSKKTRYFLNLGYKGDGGWEKVGKESTNSAFNVRSNLDYDVTSVISVNLDIAGKFNRSENNGVGTSTLFKTAATEKPNAYVMYYGDKPSIDSLGSNKGKNFYGDMVYSGYKRTEVSYAMTNLGMKFNLNNYVKGLTAKINGSFDMNNSITEGKTLTYPTLAVFPGTDSLYIYGQYNLKGNESKLADTYYRNFGGYAFANYDREFGKNAIDATLSYSFSNKSMKTDASEMNTIQDDKNMNFGFRANYAYDDKYIAEVASSYMGSNRFNKDNRWKLFNSVGASYVISKEDFIKDLGFIDYLKFKGSYGKMGYDQSIEYLKYESLYKPWTGSYNLGAKNSSKLVGTEFSQYGNEDLTFEETEEFNVGLDFRTFENRLSLNAEYYTADRTGIPKSMSNINPGVVGIPSSLVNYNAVSRKGFDICVNWSDKIGEVSYIVGGKFSSFKSKWDIYDEINDFDFENKTGTDLDAIWGYVADGYYMNEDDLANDDALTQSNGNYSSTLGTVIPGDVKYKNLSNTHDEYNESVEYGDTIINAFDKTIIGHSTPRLYYSLNLGLKYKSFSFYALGEGRTGCQKSYSNNTYFTNKGGAKYSKFVKDAAVPVTALDGSVSVENTDFKFPRLTTESKAHSYQTSTNLLYDYYKFSLSTVELDYQVPKFISDYIAAEKLNVYVRGDNLLTISQDQDLDSEYPNVGTSASYYTVSVGFKLVY